MKRILCILLGLLCLSSCSQNKSNSREEKQSIFDKESLSDSIKENKAVSDTAKQSSYSYLSEDSALNIIWNLPEVQNMYKILDTTGIGWKKWHKRIAVISFPTDDSTIYDIRAGVDGDIRFETIFMFIVDKKTCKVSVFNQLTNNTFPLLEWQERYKKYLNGDKNAFDETREEHKGNETTVKSSKTVSYPITSENLRSQFSATTNNLSQYTIRIQNEYSNPDIIYHIDTNKLIFWLDGDNEYYYLAITKNNNKIAGTLLIGKAETIEDNNGNSMDYYIDFSIDENWNIILQYSKGVGYISRKIYKEEHYKIVDDNIQKTNR